MQTSQVYTLQVLLVVVQGFTALTQNIAKSDKIDLITPIKTNKGKLIIPSEGGSIAADGLTVLPKEFTNLMNLDNDLGKSNGSSVVARKGVDPPSKEDIIKAVPHVDPPNNTSSILSPIKPNVTLNATLPKKEQGQSLPKNTTDNSTKINHKPLVLSYEALAEMDKKNKVIIDETEPSIKVTAMSSNSHPGMVMPIVITILVVPMFAVVGYMALKRGKEAWKNRHYKRMDFLLDGMYND